MNTKHFEINDTLESDGKLHIDSYHDWELSAIWIDREEAQKIIQALQEAFEL